MAGDARRLGIYGFGAAAHIVAQVARAEGRELYAFTRPGDAAAQDFARAMGAVWAGDADARPPAELDAALIFAPVGGLVPSALAAVRKGGTVVCGGIHMSDIPSLPLPPAVGGARRPLGRQPDPAGRDRLPGPRRRGADPHRGDHLPARRSQPGAGRPARRPPPGRRGADPVVRVRLRAAIAAMIAA